MDLTLEEYDKLRGDTIRDAMRIGEMSYELKAEKAARKAAEDEVMCMREAMEKLRAENLRLKSENERIGKELAQYKDMAGTQSFELSMLKTYLYLSFDKVRQMFRFLSGDIRVASLLFTFVKNTMPDKALPGQNEMVSGLLTLPAESQSDVIRETAEALKSIAERPTVGEYVATKHVEHEIQNIETGGVGIVNNK